MNRRSFIRSLMAGIAGVFVAPLMRRRTETEVLGSFAGWQVGDLISFGDGHERFRIIAVQPDKIRFVRSKPQFFGGWGRS